MLKNPKTIERVHTHTHTQAGLKNNERGIKNAFLNISIYQTDRLII